jgi:hypothetical protein
VIFHTSIRRLVEQTQVGEDYACWPTEAKTLAWPWPTTAKRHSVTPRTFMWLSEHKLPLPSSVRIVPLCKNRQCVNPAHLLAQHRWERETFPPLPLSDKLAAWDVWNGRTLLEKIAWVDVHNALFRGDKRGYPQNDGVTMTEWSPEQYRWRISVDGETYPLCGNADV